MPLTSGASTRVSVAQLLAALLEEIAVLSLYVFTLKALFRAQLMGLLQARDSNGVP